MTWFRLDDKGAFHAKVLAAGNEAYGAWCRAGQWSAERLTDGVIPLSAALAIGPKRLWTRLVAVGLIENKESSTLIIHDFLDYNPSAAEVLEERERKARNVSDFRARRKRARIAPVTAPVTGNEPGRNRGGSAVPDPDPITSSDARAEIAAELQRWPSAATLPIPEVSAMLAQRFATLAMTRGVKLAWVLTSIADAAADGVGLNAEALTRKLRIYVDRSRKPAEPALGPEIDGLEDYEQEAKRLARAKVAPITDEQRAQAAILLGMEAGK